MNKLPETCIIACNSLASNTGTIVGISVLRVYKMFQDKIGICSLPALVNEVPRQTLLVRKRIKHIIAIDECRQQCVKNILKRLKIKPDIYINVEKDLGIKKKGPFTSLDYTNEEVNKVVSSLLRKIKIFLK